MPCANSASGADKVLQRYPFLGCPECHNGLQGRNETLLCDNCNLDFDLNGGVPVLLPKSISFDQRAAEDVHQTSAGFLRRILSKGIQDYEGRKQMLKTCQGQIMSIGGGPNRESPRYTNLNLKLMENVDIVGDAARLPCVDGSLDGVVCNAILEHVRDPRRVVSEIHRVLKPGAYVLIEVPFLQHYHPSPQDFYRYTREGVLELCRDFQPISVGMTCGPMTTVVEMAESLLMIPFGNSAIVKGSVRLFLYPLRVFDLVLNRMERAQLMAHGFYFFGSKPH